MTSNAITEPGTAVAHKNKMSGKVRVMAVVAIAAGLGLATYGWHWWSDGRFMENTDDAYVGGDITVISAKVPGYITSAAVSDNQVVHAGDLLVQLDDRDYRAALAKADGAVGLGQRGPVIAVVELDQQVAGVHHLVVADGGRGDVAGHLGADDGDVAADVGVVGVFHEAAVAPPVPAVSGQAEAGGDRHHGHHADLAAHLVFVGHGSARFGDRIASHSCSLMESTRRWTSRWMENGCSVCRRACGIFGSCGPCKNKLLSQ